MVLIPCAAGEARKAASPSAWEVVEELYALVTFDAGTTPDWDRVRSLFADEAVVVLRTGLDEMTIFSLDGFVNDFVQFIEQSDVETTGFTERILKMKTTVYGDIAHILVLFDSHINGSTTPARQGIDSFQLRRATGLIGASDSQDAPRPDGRRGEASSRPNSSQRFAVSASVPPRPSIYAFTRSSPRL